MKILKLQSHLINELNKANEVCVASAIVSDSGLQILLDNIPSNCKLKLLIGIDLPTPISVFERLFELGNENIEAKVFLKESFFHPKLYLTNGKNKVVFVGSGNCTIGGLENHIELFHKISEDEMFSEYKSWFDTYFKLGTEIREEWLTQYATFFLEREVQEATERVKIKEFKRQLPANKTAINLNQIDFTNQFFKLYHHTAFEDNKVRKSFPQYDKERLEVKKRLEDLHELVYPLIINKGWDIHPHHMNNHIVSSHQHGEFTSNDLGALWLHYGRSENDLLRFKQVYGDNQTSMYQMRLQVLVHLNDVSIWLRVGKNNGSVVDRENFKNRLKEKNYQNKFYTLINKLSDDYFISINNERRSVTTFNDSAELSDFVKKDNISKHYFIIGKEYLPNSEYLSKINIADTVIKEYELLYPIYELIKTVI